MDIRPSPALALACELIARRSVTPDDAGCQQLIADRLARLDFTGETLTSGGVTNIWLRRGTGAPLFCFAGHTDVVPPGPLDAWHSDPFAPSIRDGWLYGRGAADMKASIAAFVVAVEGFVAAHPHHAGSIALLLTSDEEGPATDGTVKVVERLAARGERIDYCIVGEPTSVDRLGDTIKNGRRGTLSGELRVRGVQGHVAYPEQVRNPIHLAAPAIAELAATRWDDGNEYFPPTSFQCSNVHAGTGATNVVPGTLELSFNWRYATASTRESLVARLEEVLRRHGLDYELEFPSSGNPYLTPRGRLVDVIAAAIEAVCGRVPALSCTGGTSDGRFIADVCAEVVELGPVNATIHKLDERVAVDEVERLAALHRRVLEALLAEAPR
jgi:succinyl-diaminopimelate desuccinylase